LPVFLISDAHAQTAAPHAAAGGAGLSSSLTGMLPLLVILVVFFLLMIRPQMKKQKEHNAMISALSRGDEVVTSGGLLGKVASLSESSIGLQIASGVEVQVQRGAVVQVLPKGTLKDKE
jgi:preprotein translocase subunit YajC